MSFDMIAESPGIKYFCYGSVSIVTRQSWSKRICMVVFPLVIAHLPREKDIKMVISALKNPFHRFSR